MAHRRVAPASSRRILMTACALLLSACTVDTAVSGFRCGEGNRCPEGLVCVSSICRDPRVFDGGPGADAGVSDAGAADAGVSDAGAADGGLGGDGGTADGGLADGGIGPPTGLRVVPGAGSAEVAWDAVSGAVGYVVCYNHSRPACDGVSLSTDGGTAMRVESLPGDTRYFAVRATPAGGSDGPPTSDVDAPLFSLVERSRRDGLVPGENLGSVLAPAGDVDADGRTDYLVGWPGAMVAANANAGRVRVYSGLDARVLFMLEGDAVGARWGSALAAAGDVNGDGKGDFIIAALGAGKVRVYSGASGQVIHEITTTLTGGVAVAGVGDATGDMVPDFVVGRPGDSASKGAVTLYSGATGMEVRTWAGNAGGDRFGAAVAGAGDVNGDGMLDILVGAPGTSGGAGRAAVFTAITDAPLVDHTSPTAGLAFGFSVAGAGDVNGDGRADYMVGGPGGDPPTQAGRVIVFSGTNGEWLHDLSEGGSIVGFGTAVASAGDSDGDGRPDIAVGAPNLGAGAVFVYSGVPDVIGKRLYRVEGGQTGDRFGATLGSGDVDADGVPDLFVGAPEASPGSRAGAGSVIVLGSSGALGLSAGEHVDPLGMQGYGPAGIPALPPGRRRTLTPVGGTPPYSWAVITNRSGTATLSEGSYTAGTTPEVYDTLRLTDAVGRSIDTRVWLLNHTGQIILNGVAGDLLGNGIAGIGDRDGDGRGDYVVGAPGPVGVPTRMSYAAVYSGASPASPPHLDGPQGGDQFGYAVAAAGDVNGDGVPDFLVSAPLTDDQVGDLGKVSIYSGTDFSLLRSKLGDEGGARYGSRLAGGVDLNADGVPDYLVGSPQASPGAKSAAGSVFVYSGANGGTDTADGLLHRLNGSFAGDKLGKCVSFVDDLNGDGTPDIIAGAPEVGANTGSLFIFSGDDGAQIDRIDGSESGDEMGFSCAGLGDLDGDGAGDFAVGIRGARISAMDGAGKVVVYSGATRQVIHQFEGDVGQGGFGWTVASAGDVDGDGRADVIVGKRANGEIFVYSGADGAPLYQKTGATGVPSFFERVVAGVGDVNGDGFADFGLGFAEVDSAGSQAGQVVIYVSKPRAATLARPVAVTATPLSSTEVKISWTDRAIGEEGFRVEKRPIAGAWSSGGSVGANGTQRTVSGLSANTAYLFRVKAHNATGDSLWSPVIQAATQP